MPIITVPADSREKLMHILKSVPKERLKGFIASLPDDEKQTILTLIDELQKRRHRMHVKDDFMAFVKHVWPEFIEG